MSYYSKPLWGTRSVLRAWFYPFGIKLVSLEHFTSNMWPEFNMEITWYTIGNRHVWGLIKPALEWVIEDKTFRRLVKKGTIETENRENAWRWKFSHKVKIQVT